MRRAPFGFAERVGADGTLFDGGFAGAATAESVAAELARAESEGMRVLHRRRIPASALERRQIARLPSDADPASGMRAEGVIDHLVVTRGAVWAVSVPATAGRPQRHVGGRFLHPRVETLTVGGADQSELLDQMQAHIDRIEARFPELPVRGALCFAEERSLFGGSFSVRGVDVVAPGRLVKLLHSTDAGRIDVASAASLLGHAFPAA